MCLLFMGRWEPEKQPLYRPCAGQKEQKDHIGSPTFSLINEYRFVEGGITRSIFHIDLYRLKDEEEAMNAGVEDCLYSGNVCFVEWPEKAPSLLPDYTVHVYMYPVNDQLRRLKIEVSI